MLVAKSGGKKRRTIAVTKWEKSDFGFLLTKRRQKKTRDEFNSGYEKNVPNQNMLGSFEVANFGYFC
jgi:hypothetical protein